MKQAKYSCLEIARYVYEYSKNNKYNITITKLMKLLYFIQARTLVELNEKCFEEKILAWEYGPVVSEFFNWYKNSIYLDLLLNESKEKEIDQKMKEIINSIVDKYKDKKAFDLTKLTHDFGPWKNHWVETSLKEEIPLNEIKKYYSSKEGKEYIF